MSLLPHSECQMTFPDPSLRRTRSFVRFDFLCESAYARCGRGEMMRGVFIVSYHVIIREVPTDVYRVTFAGCTCHTTAAG